jgi:hypothetical protein
MTEDTSNRSGQPDHKVVGVYRDREEAEDAARAARQSGAQEVSVDAPEDEVTSLRGEMREETENAFMGPGSVGPFTKEMARQGAASTLIGALVGALMALPIGLAADGLPLVTRLVIALCVGAVAGAVVGAIIGGGFFRVRSHAREQLAAERGVTVGAEGPPQTAAAMESEDPVRIDLTTAEGEPEETITTEEEEEAEPRQGQRH